ncbi:MAG TPA: cupredoxin domain-containing protein [Thermoanaerobaculia bacterium]|nr:cupredoxin domain-containing protein [Thermoanaerobaculia bacterium]
MKRELLLLIPLLLLSLTVVFGAEEPRGEKVEVRLSEYAVEMPQTLPAGPATFLVRNEGRKNHSFKIEGPGIDQMLEAVVRPHETGSLQVTLQPGEYKVYCPIGSHAAKGMTMKLVVGEKREE